MVTSLEDKMYFTVNKQRLFKVNDDGTVRNIQKIHKKSLTLKNDHPYLEIVDQITP